MTPRERLLREVARLRRRFARAGNPLGPDLHIDMDGDPSEPVDAADHRRWTVFHDWKGFG